MIALPSNPSSKSSRSTSPVEAGVGKRRQQPVIGGKLDWGIPLTFRAWHLSCILYRLPRTLQVSETRRSTACLEFGDCGAGRVQLSHHTDSRMTDIAELPAVHRFAPWLKGRRAPTPGSVANVPDSTPSAISPEVLAKG